MKVDEVYDEGNSYLESIPKNIINNICFKFLEHIPEEYRNDNMRIFFEIEMAHWFYVDHYVGNPEFPQCKSVSFKEFVKLILNACSYLKSNITKYDELVEEFKIYKQYIPTNGAILIDKSLEYVLLVQGYFASSNSWGFPKGKVNEGEKSLECAIREVQEETGYDIREKVNRRRSFSRYNNKALTQLFVVIGVEMDFKFKPHLNKEIKKMQWFKIEYLPKDRNDYDSPGKIGMKPNNFYNVVPFVNDIVNYVNKETLKRKKLLKTSTAHSHSTPIFDNVTSKNFTGESFLQMIATSSKLSHSSSMPLKEEKPPTILVYEAPKESSGKDNQFNNTKKVKSEGTNSLKSNLKNEEERLKQLKRDEATSAMLKLLNIKSQK